MLMNRRLYRSRTDTILGGVAAGLAHYLNTDPALVRIAWAILVPLTGGAAFLAYIVGWIVIPEEPVAAPLAAAATLPGDEPVAEGAAGAGATAGGPAPEMTAAWTPPEPVHRSSPGNAGVWVGVGLVLLGVWFLVREYLPDINWNFIWPLFIVGIGVLVLVTATRRRDG
jgi:phage shock protein PspC (stress-responsive transcriptional regulator)